MHKEFVYPEDTFDSISNVAKYSTLLIEYIFSAGL